MTELRGRLLIDSALVPGRVTLEGETITAVETGLEDAGDTIVAPGLIDLHVHGYGGSEPLTDLAGMARALARDGTTSFLPTLFPRAPEQLGRDVATTCRQNVGAGAARSLGVHLEGPFVNPLAAGALPPEDLATPSAAGLRAILARAEEGDVRKMTFAPELPGAAELVEELVRSGVIVSLGHSRATASEARTAARAGASAATHLYNAMSGFHHRDPGLVAFALTDDSLYAELIGDLVHVGREGVELALAARGPRGLCLVSDALPGAGTGCDRFECHGREHLSRDGAFYYPGVDGGEARLAGSATGQLEAVRRLTSAGVVGIEDALTMATLGPALALGEEHLGRIEVGARADLIVLSGRELELEQVLVGGASIEADSV